MPGLDCTGPLGQGPMTGGRRGLCVPPSQRGFGLHGYGVGRGGRPYGGGRGRAWGGGRGSGVHQAWADPYYEPAYPVPEAPAPTGLLDRIDGILERLGSLAEAVGKLYSKFEQGRDESASTAKE